MVTATSSAVSNQAISNHWSNQIIKCEHIRNSSSMFFRARQSQIAARHTIKSAIPITNPNAVKIAAELNGDVPSAPPTPGNADTSPKAAVAADHPSSTVAPIADTLRITSARPPENTWNSLDMGGVGLQNVPLKSSLFSYNFLTNLYLNHNSLSSLPGEITQLRHLEVLDLSCNKFASIPPELGMLTRLKELMLFDNQLTTIPPELGTLHQLSTLGVEGNPLDHQLAAIIQKEGTPYFIAYLRDSCPVPTPPPERSWIHLASAQERDLINNDPSTEVFAVLSYNILCARAATEKMYGYTPSWALSWEYRKELILTEIVNYDAEIVCLQEVDNGQYEDYFMKLLEPHGYDSFFHSKQRHQHRSDEARRNVDGCAVFYKKAKYTLVEGHTMEFAQLAMQRVDFKRSDDVFNRVCVKDHVAVALMLENKVTSTRLVVANAHLSWDPAFRDVKLVQTALLVEQVEKFANLFARYPPKPPGPGEPAPPTYTDGTQIPTIICGDFNSVPTSGVYEYLSTGSVAPNHEDWMSYRYGDYTKVSAGPKHRFSLKSAYADSEGSASAGQPLELVPMTNYVPSFKGVLSYLWYSTASLSVNAVLGEVDKAYLEKVVGFPNAHFPSDHICIISEFRVKPPRDSTPRQPPVFS
ncbi:Endonuclease/exonuclease/phosphatase [Pterulicium gracile]|uniref:CCR4-Not complex 3'-5'-exoribonuclease subunit Ccr4 n=1 Tax=Pterulicium gracile TaxID=1884261 RepID=A0A5C3QUR9_9AGAR|nr:Endonuclease/exonuclease/phosphatase [Pterula gracilis]